MRFLLVTDPGIEDVAAAEVRERVPGTRAETSPYRTPGLVRIESDDSPALLELTTVHDVVEIRAEAEADSLDVIRSLSADLELPELDGAESFRVTSIRVGDHEFRHVDIQRVAGGALFRRYGTRVDLENSAIDVRVDLYGRHLVTGLPRNRRPLGKRILRPRPLRSALKPTIAAAMLRIAGAHRGSGRLIDPLCGSGTIPIEAKRINPRLEVVATDWDADTVEVARETVARHELDIDVRSWDARSLERLEVDPFDYLVTDPPYGVRQGRRTRLGPLYAELLASFERVLDASGKAVVIVLKQRSFRAALEQTGLRITHERLVSSGGLHPRIFVLER